MSKRGIVNEIHKPVRRRFPSRAVTLKGANDLFQADLIDMSNFKTINKNHTFILIVINAFTKKAYAVPLKNKSGPEVTAAFESVLKSLKKIPKNLQTDHGTDFYNEPFQRLMKEQSINHYSSYSEKKASIIERLIRTIKTWMFKEFSLQGSYRWLDLLPKTIALYNERVHSKTKLKPNVAHKHEKLLLKTVFKAQKAPKQNLKRFKRFKPGDLVRITKYKHIFKKGYLPNWTTELFEVSAVLPTVPVVYRLKDLNGDPILGSFYKEELQKTKYPDTYLVEKILQKKGKKVQVKWLGFEQPTWIPKSDVL